jgi:hypothetical protein
MKTLIPSFPFPRPDRRRRCARPLVEGLEVRQVPSSFQLPSSIILLKPQAPPPGSSLITVHVSPGPIMPQYNPGPIFPPGPI